MPAFSASTAGFCKFRPARRFTCQTSLLCDLESTRMDISPTACYRCRQQKVSYHAICSAERRRPVFNSANALAIARSAVAVEISRLIASIPRLQIGACSLCRGCGEVEIATSWRLLCKHSTGPAGLSMPDDAAVVLTQPVGPIITSVFSSPIFPNSRVQLCFLTRPLLFPTIRIIRSRSSYCRVYVHFLPSSRRRGRQAG